MLASRCVTTWAKRCQGAVASVAADGLVEEEAVGAEEQRPENGPEHQLRHDGQPPLP